MSTTVLDRLNHSVALTDEQLRRMAPSIFATSGDDDRSARYTPVPTFAIIEELRNEGFEVVNAFQSKAKDKEGSGVEYAKHQVILRPRENSKLLKVGDTRAEISLINSHNGTSAAVISGALFRLACLNGLTVPDGLAEVTKVYHTGNVIDEIVAGMRKAVEGSKQTMERIREWSTIELTKDEQGIFSQYAHQIRFGASEEDENGNLSTILQPQDLLRVNRYDDNKNDLWTVLNRIQENSLQATLGRNPRTGNQMATRPITSIDRRREINESLMTMGKVLADYKAG